MRRDVEAWAEMERPAIQRQRFATERRETRRPGNDHRRTGIRSMRRCCYRASSSVRVHVQRQLPAGAVGMACRRRRRGARPPPSSASTSVHVPYLERHKLFPALSSLHTQARNRHAYVVSRALGLWRCHERDNEPPLLFREGASHESYQRTQAFTIYSLRTPWDHH